MLKAIKIATAVATSLSLVGGLAGVAGASSISNTGPQSRNTTSSEYKQHTMVTNSNVLSASNSNDQAASTGAAEAQHNTTAGDATSGDSSNNNSVMTAATVDNTGAATMAATMMDPSSVGTGTSDTASIDTTGPNSYNDVSSKTTVDTTVDNTNDIAVTNENTQSASSGKAEVSDNTTGGSATSGDASNTSSTTTTLMVSN